MATVSVAPSSLLNEIISGAAAIWLGQVTARPLAESLEAGWQLLRDLPPAELTRLSDEQIARHLAP